MCCCYPLVASDSSSHDFSMATSPATPCAGGDTDRSSAAHNSIPPLERTTSGEVPRYRSRGKAVLRTVRSGPEGSTGCGCGDACEERLLARSSDAERSGFGCDSACQTGNPSCSREPRSGCCTSAPTSGGSCKSAGGCVSSQLPGLSDNCTVSGGCSKDVALGSAEASTCPEATPLLSSLPAAPLLTTTTSVGVVLDQLKRRPVHRVSAKGAVIRKRVTPDEPSVGSKPRFGDLEDLWRQDSEARNFCSFECNAPAMCRSGREGVVEPSSAGAEGSGGDSHGRRKRVKLLSDSTPKSPSITAW